MNKGLAFIVADSVRDTGELSRNFIPMSGVGEETASSAAPYGVLTVQRKYMLKKSWGISIPGLKKVTFVEWSVSKQDEYAGIHFRAEQHKPRSKHFDWVTDWRLHVRNATQSLDPKQFEHDARWLIEEIPKNCIVLMTKDTYAMISPALRDLEFSVQRVAGELATS